MARYIGPKSRLSRREGENLLLKKRCSSEVRNYPPGQHGNMRKGKLSDYGIQLREKQKVKRLYGVLERQFRLYYEKAAKSKGVTGTVLLQFLERRLDNVIFRLGFASTRSQGRQIVTHGLTYVNNQRVDIPSFLVKEGDEISFKSNDKIYKYLKANLEATKDWKVPTWLAADPQHFKGQVKQMPTREDVQFPINEQLIIELYSK
jgi:small subunit ribosomal protein S4